MPAGPAAANIPWLVPALSGAALSGFFLTMLHRRERARTEWCRPRAERLAASDDDEATGGGGARHARAPRGAALPRPQLADDGHGAPELEAAFASAHDLVAGYRRAAAGARAQIGQLEADAVGLRAAAADAAESRATELALLHEVELLQRQLATVRHNASAASASTPRSATGGGDGQGREAMLLVLEDLRDTRLRVGRGRGDEELKLFPGEAAAGLGMEGAMEAVQAEMSAIKRLVLSADEQTRSAELSAIHANQRAEALAEERDSLSFLHDAAWQATISTESPVLSSSPRPGSRGRLSDSVAESAVLESPALGNVSGWAAGLGDASASSFASLRSVGSAALEASSLEAPAVRAPRFDEQPQSATPVRRRVLAERPWAPSFTTHTARTSAQTETLLRYYAGSGHWHCQAAATIRGRDLAAVLRDATGSRFGEQEAAGEFVLARRAAGSGTGVAWL